MNFKIIVKLSWCQSGATRREGFAKLGVAHLDAVNTGLPTGENALQCAWSLSLSQ